MTKFTLQFLALTVLLACSKDSDSPSRKELLTGGSQKSWYLYTSLCRSDVDDSWTFFSDGNFEYNNGTITEDQQGGCGDLVDLVGTWALKSNETTLEIIMLNEKGKPANSFNNDIFMYGAISELTNSKLTLKYSDPSGKIGFIEFRER